MKKNNNCDFVFLRGNGDAKGGGIFYIRGKGRVKFDISPKLLARCSCVSANKAQDLPLIPTLTSPNGRGGRETPILLDTTKLS